MLLIRGEEKLKRVHWGVLALSLIGLGNAHANESSNVTKVNEIDAYPSRVFVDHDGHLLDMQYIRGETKIITPDSPVDSFSLDDDAVLRIINGGKVDAVISKNSTVIIESGVVKSGLHIYHSNASLNNAIIENASGFGLAIGSIGNDPRYGSEASANSTTISGKDHGVAVGLYGSLRMSNTEVFNTSGNGSGMLMTNSILEASGNSVVQGAVHGIEINDGYDFVPAIEIDRRTFVTLDHSLIEGRSGAAIKIGRPNIYATEADITIRNGAMLRSGNGNLIEVDSGSIVNVIVDNSSLEGDLVADESSKLDISLRNNAELWGRLINANSLSVDSGAHWRMVGDNQIKSLMLSGGDVSFGGQDFYTLSVGELSGSGTFGMRINFDAGEGDLLEVNGRAEGSHLLAIQNPGVEGISPDIEPLRIVHTESGDAQFSLLGSRVDLGAYSYLLEKQGTDWFIVGSGKTISPSTQSALALFNAAPVIWNSELATLRSRMGEVRRQEEGGGWIRSYGNRFNASTAAGINYQQKQQGLSFGADAPIPVASGNLVLGLMGGYSKSDLDLNRGTSGTVNSYYVGAYGTWLSEEGYYLDGVLKLNKFRNESDVAMTDGSKTKGRYNNTGIGGSVEFGKHIKLSDDYFVEPFTQLSSVLIGGDSYTMSNGLKAKNSRTQSVSGKVGTTAGRNFMLDDGSVVQPYVRVAMAHEFARSNDVKVNDTRFDNNLFGSRAELGAGVAVSLSERIQLHADFDYMKGEHVEQPWGANVGLKLAF